MDRQDMREPVRDARLAEVLEEAAPTPPFTDVEVAAVQARIMRDARATMRRRRIETRARRFAYRVVLPASLAAELLIAFRLATPPESVEPSGAAEIEIMQTIALDAMLGTDLGFALITGNVYPTGLNVGTSERQPNGE